MGRYIHHIPGRIRIKCPEIRGNAERACALDAVLRNRPGVVELTVKTVTGSLLIKFEPSQTSAEELLTAVHEASFGTWQPPSLPTPTHVEPIGSFFGKRLRRAGKRVSKTVASVLLEKALERSAVALIGALL